VDRFKKLGQLLGTEKPKERPAEVAVERRAGRRVALPIPIRFTLSDGSTHDGKTLEVNLAGLSLEPPAGAQIGSRLSIGFQGYPGVCEPFVLVGEVRQVVTDPESGAPTALGIQIDRRATSPEESKSYRALVKHYLHHRPLLNDVDKGYFEGRCPSCQWIGRVGRRNPVCSRCGTKVEPIQAEDG
jgi:hypothetical protein